MCAFCRRFAGSPQDAALKGPHCSGLVMLLLLQHLAAQCGGAAWRLVGIAVKAMLAFSQHSSVVNGQGIYLSARTCECEKVWFCICVWGSLLRQSDSEHLHCSVYASPFTCSVTFNTTLSSVWRCGQCTPPGLSEVYMFCRPWKSARTAH